jgi:hypothetical protein
MIIKILLSKQSPPQSLINGRDGIAVINRNFAIIVGLLQINIFKLSIVFEDHAYHLYVILMHRKMKGCVS